MALTATTAGIIGGTMAAKAGMDYLKNRLQQSAERTAAKNAAAISQEGARQAVTAAESSYDMAMDAYNRSSQQAEAALRSGNTEDARVYQAQADQARQTMQSGFGQARGDLASGFGQARSDLASGYGQAREDLGSMASLAKYGTAALTGEGFQADPGYQFRLQQGQQALDRAQAAAGGRLSGAAIKRAMEYNQGMASSEYDKWASRAMQLGQVGYGAQGRLADYAAQSGQNFADLSARGGQNFADLSARGGQVLGGLDLSAGQYMSGLSEQGSGRLADLYLSGGVNAANAATNLGAQRAGAYTNQAAQLIPMQSAGNQFAGSGWGALSDITGDLGTMAMFGYGSGMFGGAGGEGALAGKRGY